METLVVVGVLFAGLYYWNLARTGANIVWANCNFKSIQIGITPVINASLVAQNTGNATLNINSLAAVVTSNGYQVGNVSSFTVTPILPNSQTEVPITISLQLIGVVSDIINVFNTGVREQELSIDGHANINGIQIPVNVKMKL